MVGAMNGRPASAIYVCRAERFVHRDRLIRPFRVAGNGAWPVCKTFARKTPARKTPAALILALFLACHGSSPAWAAVLPKEDLERVASIKASFTMMIVDVNEAQRRPDLTENERECMHTISQDLLQIGQELSGYEALMKIESQLNAYSDEGTTREVVLFALNKALDVLHAERRRLAQPPDQCARLPNATAKARSLMQVIDATITTLEAVRSRV